MPKSGLPNDTWGTHQVTYRAAIIDYPNDTRGTPNDI